MLWTSAYNLMVAGKAIRSGAWRNNEFIVMCNGGSLPAYYEFDGLGVSNEVMDMLRTMDAKEVRIVPHIIRFIGPELILYDAALSSSDMLCTDWGIYNGHTTDFLVWKEGTKLIDPRGKVGKVVKRDGDNIYHTFTDSRSRTKVTTIDQLYLEGIRENNKQFN